MKKTIFDNNSEIAVKIGDRMVGIQESESGFDYSIYDMNYKVLDGGIIHNKDKSIDETLNEIIDDLKASKYDTIRDIYYRDEIQGNIAINDEPVRIDYEEYLERKARQRNIEVTYQVAECSEFPSFGELHENIKTAQEAMQIYKSIPPERMHAIPAININIHESGKETYEDDQVEIFVNGRFDLETLEYIPYVLELENTARAIAELLYIKPDAEIIGNIPPMIQSRLNEIKQENMNPIEKLAFYIDNFSRDYDHYGYEDNVVDREENVNNIKISIETGDSGYLKEWLTEVILNSELNNSILCAKQLLSRLEHAAKILEYKPLAKVEELEEENYNRIDGVIDTTEKNNKENHKNQYVRVSIKEKLAEKRAEIERKSKRQCECSKEDEPVRL